MNLKIEYVKTDEIAPYPGNAKLHPAAQIEQIKKSIQEYGFADPIAIWKNGEVIEGHGRLIAAHELGLEKVPVIRLDDLTDEQRKAYTLVHNKLTLNSGFDMATLAEELAALELQGVDLAEFDLIVPELDADDGGYYGDERMRTNKAYNLDIAHDTPMTDDFWQMPIIPAAHYIPDDLIGFNYAKTSDNKTAGVHFYVDDYQFERIWNDPEKYTEILWPYDCILSPDFSLYMDMPMPMKIWNVYRSRQIGAYYAAHGLTVIPTLSWAEPATYQFCFNGIERGSAVSVSTVGVKESKEALAVWSDGMAEALKQIEPEAVLVYGGDIGFDFGNVTAKYYENHVTERWGK